MDALAQINGNAGYTNAYELTEVLPYLSGLTASVSGSTLTIDGYSSDPGDVHIALVPAGSAAPSKAQIVAGSGGSIAFHASEALSATLPGEAFSIDIAGTASTAFDWYAVIALSSGEVSEAKSGTETLLAITREWDATLHAANYVYSNNNRTITYSAGGAFYARGKPVSAGGKFYFEIVADAGKPSYVGIGVDDIVAGGGTAGVHKAGWTEGIVHFTGGNTFMGGVLVAGDVVGFAFDTENQLLWVRRNSENWNNDGTADPATGLGGLDVSGMDMTAIVPIASCFTGDVVTGNFDPGNFSATAPAGFGPIG